MVRTYILNNISYYMHQGCKLVILVANVSIERFISWCKPWVTFRLIKFKNLVKTLRRSDFMKTGHLLDWKSTIRYSLYCLRAGSAWENLETAPNSLVPDWNKRTRGCPPSILLTFWSTEKIERTRPRSNVNPIYVAGVMFMFWFHFVLLVSVSCILSCSYVHLL